MRDFWQGDILAIPHTDAVRTPVFLLTNRVITVATVKIRAGLACYDNIFCIYSSYKSV